MPHAWVEVDLDAIRANVRALRAALRPSVDFIAVVKGNAYGHGAVETARTVLDAGATHLGVAFATEGRELRQAGIAAPILVLGSFGEDDVDDILTCSLTPSVGEVGLGAALARAARSRSLTVPVHLEVDTGMGRLGVDWRTAARVVEDLTATQGLRLEGIFTHFATADEPDHSYTRLQVKRFQQVQDALTAKGIFVPFRHYSNSAGVLHYPETVLDAVRPGLAIYGLYPARGAGPLPRLEPAMAFRSRVAMVKRLGAGAFVSYGRTFRLPEPRYIATVSVGYADGYPRLLSNRASVSIRESRYPVVGTVTMDHIMVDLGREATPIRCGDRVTLFGRDGSTVIPAEELAELAGTIHYEITTRISARAPRIYKGRRAAGGGT
ncbi:MAG: alanine racemase [Candidatus Riflebacteria bacterium]|nr:alanine racemase [Candidatus Riflebacteria bacterium]